MTLVWERLPPVLVIAEADIGPPSGVPVEYMLAPVVVAGTFPCTDVSPAEPPEPRIGWLWPAS